jgi:hypothetical protein
MDAKAVVKMGELSRDGRTRAPTVALDHDFTGTMVTPMGFLLPQHDELYIYMSQNPSRRFQKPTPYSTTGLFGKASAIAR